ncbi:MAG: pentapeptide repeat-containing protein [Synechococcales cyanobacterium K44_A2020_017]|nr:pentapeptide repeat-containing protein [Synechococcales cyanobacterium K32_A2020_035]MBF2093987.1 pentapeptide repeat-containing protein [Synechococcales cyanobacterium K44_A2020_017]
MTSSPPDQDRSHEPEAQPLPKTTPSPSESGVRAFLRAIIQAMRSIKVPREAIGAVVGASITAFATLSIAIVNLLNGFNEQLNRPFQIQDSLSKTQLTADYYRQTALSTYLSSAGMVLMQTHDHRTLEQVATLRALTHATLRELNAERKRYVVMLLQDAQVLAWRPEENQAMGQPAFLFQASLMGANLEGLDLQGTDLRGADLRAVNFRYANLSHAHLTGANLTGADLRSADLSHADVERVEFLNACYNGRTVLDVNIDPTTAGMKKVTESDICTPEVPSSSDPVST